METTLKYYDNSHILAAFKFTLKIIEQVFGAVVGDDGMRLGRIFSFLVAFLLVTYILFYFAYFAINSVT